MSVRFILSFTFFIFTMTLAFEKLSKLISSAPMQLDSEAASPSRVEENVVAHDAIMPAIAIVNAIRRTDAISGDMPFFALFILSLYFYCFSYLYIFLAVLRRAVKDIRRA